MTDGFESEHLGSWGESRADKERGSKNDFVIKSGEECQIRFVTENKEVKIHWNAHSEHKMLVCRKTISKSEECPICEYIASSTDLEFKERAFAKWNNYVYLIDRRDGKIKKWRFSLTVKGLVASIIQNANIDILDYDLRVKRVGEGFNTKYKIIKSASPILLTADEKQMIAEQKSLDEVYTAKSVEELRQLFNYSTSTDFRETDIQDGSEFLDGEETIPF